MSTKVTPKYTHLYYEYWACWDGCPVGPHECNVIRACPITRITAKRIYFRGSPDGGKWMRNREFYIDRAAIENGGDLVGRVLSNGGVYHRGLRQILHLTPPERESAAFRRIMAATAPDDVKSVTELRREMADLHPDRGGDPAAFRAAHRRYMAAKRVNR